MAMFALPNIQVTESIDVPHFAIMYSQDPRVVELAKKHENFMFYLEHFTTEFEVKVLPSLLMFDDSGPGSYRSTEAISAFRDALALSVIPYKQSHSIKYQRPEKLRFTDWFRIYPWMVDKNYEYVIMRSSGSLSLHETKQLRSQTSPGLYQELLGTNDIDCTLHNELMLRWQRRFTAEKPEWQDVALFRSLNMANIAAEFPSQGDFTPYDTGRAIALWASAFEILAHPEEGQSGHLQVYDLLERAQWRSTACNEARHPAMAPADKRRPRILGCAIYSRIHTARNDYLHGNKVSDVQLVIAPSKRFLPDYVPVLYRIALTAFLDLTFKE